MSAKELALFENFRSEITQMKAKGTVKLGIYSFSYAKGVPEDPWGHGGGFVFDCRCLPNPFWEERLRRFSGKDESIREFFAEHREEVEAFAGAAESLVRQTIRVFQSDGRQHLHVAFGCTGGQHRSVFMAEELAWRLRGTPGLETEVVHTRAGTWRCWPNNKTREGCGLWQDL